MCAEAVYRGDLPAYRKLVAEWWDIEVPHDATHEDVRRLVADATELRVAMYADDTAQLLDEAEG